MKTANQNALVEKAEHWLCQSVLPDIDEAVEEGEKLAIEAETLKQTEPRTFGPMFGRLKSRLGFLIDMERIPWHPLSGGKICVGHRPSKKKLEALRLQGATHVLTLLTASEGANSIEKSAKLQDLNWLWFAMEDGAPLAASRDLEVRQLFSDLKSLLENGGCIYVHCSAGIHRTGMLTNGLLRFLGNSQGQANKILATLRQETSEGVGEHRKAWGDRFG